MSRISRFESRIASASNMISLANQIARFETYLSKAFTAIQTVFGLAIRSVRFEIAATRWRFEPLRTANREPRFKRSNIETAQPP